MPNYRRALVPGGTFFFTVVTYQRIRILLDPRAREMLRAAIRVCRARWPFEIDAFVLMDDHLHAMWTLPPGDSDFSRRCAVIKKEFSQAWLGAGGATRAVTAGESADRRVGVWQPRFWEHVIRDQSDLHAHLDYIHFNPVKHGLCACPHAWPFTSFHRWQRQGDYEPDWLCACGGRAVKPPDFSALPVSEME